MQIFLLSLMVIFSSACDKSNSLYPQTQPASSLSPLPKTDQSEKGSFTEEVLDLINDHRSSIGLRPMMMNSDLSTIVLKHSLAMAKGTVAFGHSGFSKRCSESYSFLGGGDLCAENVAKSQSTPQKAFEAWMNSESHRSHLEDPLATHTGIAFAISSTGTYYWTQIFINY